MDPLTETLRALLLTGHLLTNALAGTGPLVVALLRLLPGLQSGEGDDALRRVMVGSLAALGVGLVIGGVSLTWVGGFGVSGGEASAYRQAIGRLPAGAIGMLVGEWFFTLVLYGAALASWRWGARRPLVHAVLAIVGATNLLYHFPTMMVVLGALADDPTLTSEAVVTRPVFLSMLWQPALLSKAVHYWAYSVLVAGLAVAWAAARAGALRADDGDPSEQENPVAVAGGVVSLAGVALLMLSGVVALTQASAATQRALLGGAPLASAAFAGAILVALLIGRSMLAVALGEPSARSVCGAMMLTALATLGMVWASRSVSFVGF